MKFQIGKVYVAFPDASKHRTYLFSLPQRMNIITEEISREIPIRRAHSKYSITLLLYNECRDYFLKL